MNDFRQVSKELTIEASNARRIFYDSNEASRIRLFIELTKELAVAKGYLTDVIEDWQSRQDVINDAAEYYDYRSCHLCNAWVKPFACSHACSKCGEVESDWCDCEVCEDCEEKPMHCECVGDSK